MNRSMSLCFSFILLTGLMDFSGRSHYGHSKTLVLHNLQDTIPPYFTNSPQDRSLSCDQDVLQSLTDWYDDHAGADAEDDSGVATIMRLLTLDSVLHVFESSKDSLCGNTGLVELGFYAVDSCGNTSPDTLYASFSTFDNQRPQVIANAQSQSITCDSTSNMILKDWIDGIGGAVLQDNCSDTVEWFSFIWNDNFGNSGNGIPGSGPYIPINRNSCSWSVTVSFLARDECGNNQITSANFNVVDSIAPVFLDLPSDITLDCQNDLPDNTLMAFDNCLGMVKANLSESSTRSSNPNSCNYYNYTITRNWSITDGCGFTANHTQVIEVIDTLTPGFVVPPDITISCSAEADTSITGVPIDIIDNCDANLMISYSDSEEFDGCNTIINRFWQINDNCGSSSISPQTITVIDTLPPSIDTAPEDVSIYCNNNIDVDSIFLNWVANLGFSSSSDGCNDIQHYTAVPGSVDLNDPGSFPGIAVDSLDGIECAPDQPGIVRTEEVEFIYVDACQNASSAIARFTVLDTLAPEFLIIPSDTILSTDSIECNLSVRILFPPFSDNCVKDTLIQKSISINQGINQLLDSMYLDTILEIGQHDVQFNLLDCAGNLASLSSLITVADSSPPMVSCPADITVSTDSTGCSAFVEFPEDFSLFDNCSTSQNMSLQSPADQDSSYLKFAFDDQLQTYIAVDKIFTFNNLQDQKAIDSVRLEIQLQADVNDSSEYFTILGDNGNSLGQIQSLGADSCDQLLDFIFTISKETFNNWIADDQVIISAISNRDNINISKGINPCDTILTIDQTDGISQMSLSIHYQLSPTYFFATGATQIASKALIATDTAKIEEFNLGNTELFIVGLDQSGNSDTCSFQILVEDQILPFISCVEDSIIFDISSIDTFQLETLGLIDSLSDNCNIDSISFTPEIIDCNSIGQPLSVEISVFDEAGNKSECSTVIYSAIEEIAPSFLAGICTGDTLKLLSNFTAEIPDSLLSFQWTGPNDFSSMLPDPTIADSSPELSGTYVLEITSQHGCSSTGSVEVFIEDLQTPVLESSGETFCSGETVSLNSTDYSGKISYEWYEGNYPNGVLINSGESPLLSIVPPTGTHFYYVLVQSENCEAPPSNELEITIVEKPEPEVQDLFLTLCEGDSIALHALNPDSTLSYQWFGPNGFSSTDPNPEPLENIAVDDQGFYELYLINGSCISDTVSTQVIVFERPVLPIITGEAIYCTGNFIALSVENVFTAFEYRWFKDGDLFTVQNSNSLIIPNANNTFNGDWRVIVNDGLCDSDPSETLTIFVEDDLTIGAASNSPVCVTDSILFSASSIPNASYSWEGPGGFISDEQNPIADPVGGEYTLTVTSNSGCTTVTSTTVEIVEQPAITALSNSAMNCTNGNEDVMLVPSVFPPGDYDYIWTGPNGFSSSDSNPVITNVSVSDNGTYELIISNGSCVSESVSTTINVTEIPDAVTIKGFNLLCRDDDLTLTVETDQLNISEYTWTTPKGQFTTLEPEFTVVQTDFDDSGEYQVRVSKSGCVSPLSNILDVDIVDEPPVPTASYTSPVCDGSVLELFTAPLPGAVYEWRGPNEFFANNRNPIIFNVSEFYEGNYSVRVTLNGCISAWSEPVQVIIQDVPESPIAIDEGYNICENSSQSILLCIEENSGTVGASYKWVNANMETIGESATACFELSDFSVLKEGNNQLSAVAVLGSCESPPSNLINLAFDTIPEVKADAGDDQIVCQPDLNTLGAALPGGLTGQWQSPNQVQIIDPGDPKSFVSDLDEGLNIFIWSISNGSCQVFSKDTVKFILETAPALSDENFITEYSESIIFNILDNDIFPLENELSIIKDVQGVQYTLMEDGTFEFDPGSSFAGNAEFIYQICSKSCPLLCDMAFINIEVEGQMDCIAPSIITPNGDGINDFFIIPCIDSGNYPTNELIIFNQWGNEIFSASPYQNNWAGTYKGNLLPSGTYFYIMDLGDGSSPLNGFILIEF